MRRRDLIEGLLNMMNRLLSWSVNRNTIQINYESEHLFLSQKYSRRIVA